MPEVLDVWLTSRQRDVEVGQHELLLDLVLRGFIQQGDLQQVVRIEHLARHADLLGDETRRRDSAALAVAAVLHLD
jgi:hypothetical protein